MTNYKALTIVWTEEYGLYNIKRDFKYDLPFETLSRFRQLTSDFKKGSMMYTEYRKGMEQLRVGLPLEVVTFLYEYVSG
jgi:hypothetical protein